MADDEALPDGIDPEIWFECIHHPGSRDYLVSEPWQTSPGRMQAWCGTRHVWFRVSKSSLPEHLPLPTRYWVEGFLVGNVPRQPDVDDDDDGAAVNEWRASAHHFIATGRWP